MHQLHSVPLYYRSPGTRSTSRMAAQGHVNLAFLVFAIIVLHQGIQSYELKLDKEQDRILWKFSGHYLYTQSSEDLEDLLNTGTFSSRSRPSTAATGSDKPNLQLPQNGLFDNTSNVRSGIWFTKHIPNRQNNLVLTYSLKHALFTQGWVSFYATPKVAVKIKTNQGEEVARFWNDGQNWCDAVVSMGLKTTFTLEVSTPEPQEYFLLDKIIMGIFSNVSQLNGRKLNPCLTSPSQMSESGSFPPLAQTLSRQSRDFGKSNNVNLESNHLTQNEQKNASSSSSVLDHSTAQTTTKTMDTKVEHEEDTMSSNRQSRSSDNSDCDSHQGRLSSSNSLKDQSSKSTSNIDLRLAIPLDSSILQHVKTVNRTAIQSQSLQCSCSCSSSL